MQEVLEVILKVVLLIGLFYMAWFDYRTKLIEEKWLMVLGIFGALGVMLRGDMALIFQSVLGMLVGAILLLFSRISGESVGLGDGWLFVVTGIFLGLLKNAVLFLGSMILAGVFAAGCLIIKKKGRYDRIALAPFVLTAYVVFVL